MIFVAPAWQSLLAVAKQAFSDFCQPTTPCLKGVPDQNALIDCKLQRRFQQYDTAAPAAGDFTGFNSTTTPVDGPAGRQEGVSQTSF